MTPCLYVKSKHPIYEAVTKPPTIIPLPLPEEMTMCRWDYSSKGFYSCVNIIMNKRWIILYIYLYHFLFFLLNSVSWTYFPCQHTAKYPIDGHFSCFQFFLITSSTTMNILGSSRIFSGEFCLLVGYFRRKFLQVSLPAQRPWIFSIRFKSFPPPALYQCIRPQSHVEHLENV